MEPIVRLSKIAPILLFISYIFTVRGGSNFGPYIYMLDICLGLICLSYVILDRYCKPVSLWGIIAMLVLFTMTLLLSPAEVLGWKYEGIGVVPIYKEYMKYVLFFLFFFIGYVLELKQIATDKYWVFIGLSFFLVSCACFGIYLSVITEKFGINYQNNTAYLLVSVIPFIPLFFRYFKRKLIPITILVILSVLIITASKRGAIICLFCSLLLMIFFYLKESRGNVKKIVVVFVLGIISAFLIYYLISTNDYLMTRLMRMEEGNYGARSVAYPTMWRNWIYSPNVEYFFGGGLCHSVSVWGNFAHNDWLEILCSNELLGVSIYAFIFISITISIYQWDADTMLKLSAYLCLTIWFLKTIFSMGYSDTYNCMLMMLLGCYIANSLDNNCC